MLVVGNIIFDTNLLLNIFSNRNNNAIDNWLCDFQTSYDEINFRKDFLIDDKVDCVLSISNTVEYDGTIIGYLEVDEDFQNYKFPLNELKTQVNKAVNELIEQFNKEMKTNKYAKEPDNIVDWLYDNSQFYIPLSDNIEIPRFTTVTILKAVYDMKDFDLDYT